MPLNRSSGPALVITWLLIASYAGCDPDLDVISSEYGGGAPGGGTAGVNGDAGNGDAAGTSGSGPQPGSAGAAGSDDPGHTAGAGGTDAPPQGVAGEAGAGGTSTGGSAGSAGSGSNPVECESGLTTCPGQPECSTDLDLGVPDGHTVIHCGACGVTCSLASAASTTCAEGACTPMCVPGYYDCNADSVNDGCETHLNALNRCGTTCNQTEVCDLEQVCNAGSCVPAQGLVVFSVPLTEPNKAQRYADRFLQRPPNLTNTSVTIRLYAPGATGGSINIYVSDQDFTGLDGVVTPLADIEEGWTDVVIPVAGVVEKVNSSTGAVEIFDPSVISQINMEIQSGSVGPWTEATVVYVDAIWSSNGALSRTYDEDIQDTVQSGSLTIGGSTLQWVDALP